MALYAIAPPEGQSAEDRARVAQEGLGPGFHQTDVGYRQLMTDAGFVDIEILDLTDEFHDTLTAWIRGRETHRERLIELIGEDAVVERRKHDLANLHAIEEGLLSRILVSGVRT